MRPRRPEGRSSTSSPTTRWPSANVPVTTVPKPGMEKTRSTGRRGRPRSGRESVSCNSRFRVRKSSGKPAFVRDETRRMGASCKVVFCRAVRISASTRSSQLGSFTKSILVNATIPLLICRRSRMARCSRVWGITPSSAAMTRSTASMPQTPASMFSMKSRWPGTSTMPTSEPPGSVSQAKPRSMVISRSCSSLRRSGLMPVRAAMSVDLPWSTWPAVPMTRIFPHIVGARYSLRERCIVPLLISCS